LAVQILGRDAAEVIRAPLRRSNYRALVGMLRRYPEPVHNARRYLTGWGEYPYRCRIRTPTGTIAPTLYSWHDMLTVNEVFCREDYRAPGRRQVTVDIGSNIGLSALYFLTENPASQSYLFEPDPRNVSRLLRNLAGYEDRYTLCQAAVAVHDGEAQFGIEQSGRYGLLTGQLGVGNPISPPLELITVRTRAINDVLEEVLDREPEIDVLKVDTEGSEIELVASIREDLLDRIRNIFYESACSHPLHESHYQFRFSRPTNVLTHRDR
jgi:FkbM family methyltransferase